MYIYIHIDLLYYIMLAMGRASRPHLLLYRWHKVKYNQYNNASNQPSATNQSHMGGN